ncbi:hypothetical protein D1BOALGB6SA_10125 [Olavius sp. associated proteobacterium Delta 1]|nr:hypothetical protein D1BOALGB6SA_10125 [Olavius sp. associated proteobacterium Delta 1]
MKKKKALIFISIIAIAVTNSFWPFKAAALEHTCQIKADRDNIHLYVRDVDRDGNPTRRIIFRGWLLQGQTISLKSLSGRISVNFKADSAKRGSGSNELKCSGNQTHTLP